jgi:hypothetical protein
MIFQGIEDCARANCTFFEENFKFQEFQNSWLGRFVTILDQDCLISNIVRPIFFYFSYFNNAVEVLRQGLNPIALTVSLNSMSDVDAIKMLRFSLEKYEEADFDSIIPPLTSKIILSMPEYNEFNKGVYYNYKVYNRLSHLGLVSKENDGWIPYTVLSHLIQHPEFLDCLCRFDQASLLSAQIDNEAQNLIMNRLYQHGLPISVSMEQLVGVIVNIRNLIETRYPLTSNALGNGREGPFSSAAIIWLADGDEKMLIDYMGIFLNNLSDFQFDQEDICDTSSSLNQRWSTLFWLAEATKKNVTPESPDWVKKQVSLNPEFYGETLDIWLNRDNGYKHHIRKDSNSIVVADNKKTYKSIVAAFELDQEKQNKFNLFHESLENSFTREMVLHNLTSKECVNKCMGVFNFISHTTTLGGLQSDGEKEMVSTVKNEVVINVLTQKLRVKGENYACDILKYKDEESHNSGLFSSMPKEILSSIWGYLLPPDIVRFSGTCRPIFLHITGPEGSSTWAARGYGSIGAVRKMYAIMMNISQKIDLKANQMSTIVPEKIFDKSKYLPLLHVLSAAWPEMSYLHKQLELDLI